MKKVPNVLIVGIGRVGRRLTHMLNPHFNLFLHDVENDRAIQVIDEIQTSNQSVGQIQRKSKMNVPEFVKSKSLDTSMSGMDAVVCATPFSNVLQVAKEALKHQIHYFDLTEDVEVCRQVKKMVDQEKSTNQRACFFQQNGVAPGYVSLLADENMKQSGISDFQEVILRVGALPIHAHNDFQYAFTWSPEGCINQYIHPCRILSNFQMTSIDPFSLHREIRIHGQLFEEFTTSGGIGSLCETYQGKVQNMVYKTLRYPPHVDRMKFLCQLFHDSPKELENLLKKSIPNTLQDQVIIHTTVKGHRRDGQLYETSMTRKVLPSHHGFTFSAIENATSAGVAGILDTVLNGSKSFPPGYRKVEEIGYPLFSKSKFASFFQSTV